MAQTADAAMIGRQIKFDYLRRCDFCNKAVKIGYLVNDPQLKGFFCGAPHARAAYEDMQKKKKELNIKNEQS
jgi:hypothetical protein